MSKHKHKWKISHINWEYPGGLTGTAMYIQYAYLLCQCTEVKRIEVNQKSPTTHPATQSFVTGFVTRGI